MKFSILFRTKILAINFSGGIDRRLRVVRSAYARYRLTSLIEKEIIRAQQLESELSGSVEEHRSSKIATRADTILLFVCPTPDDAEATVGDLMERFEQVRARKSWRISLVYFYWELVLLTVMKAKKRLVGATIGPFRNRLFQGSS